jgi:hypothetical protein
MAYDDFEFLLIKLGEFNAAASRGQLPAASSKWTNERGRQLRRLRDTKLLYRELGNLCRIFNASLADLEYLLGDNPGEEIVTVFKT